MSDQFSIVPLDQLLKIILQQLASGRLFGLPESLFFTPGPADAFSTIRYGQSLETPIGIAAGPHTQLTHNIVLAWLAGARYIELKTVQTLDEIAVAKPCIDMQDEGYNCEWSQELKIDESFRQYLNAWIIIHVLRHKLRHSAADAPGMIFNMSVGYDYKGIQHKNVQWFLDKMSDAGEEIRQGLKSIEAIYPGAVKLEINPCISNNITLSTMHGCPVDEIEKIGRYFIEERKLHTTIKLNPTLLGEDELFRLLDRSGFETKIPRSTFEHDPKLDEMVSIIQNLRQSALENKVQFGIKLTNTLESRNHKNTFPSTEQRMYMSGRALHPVSVRLAEKLQEKFNGTLDISFSGGADAFNMAALIRCGLHPVTVCSDLLKPGGYGRLNQYLEEIGAAFERHGARSVDDFIVHGNAASSVEQSALMNLKTYAGQVLTDERYKKTALHDPDIKTVRQLSFFDCIHPPCVENCPTRQDIPSYLYYSSKRQNDQAHRVILNTNPFPRMTGMVCDHLCQLKCTRIHYDAPVQIREVKRYIAENAANGTPALPQKNQKKAAVIGAGPSGLSCAYFLARAGFGVTVYEKKNRPGGMVTGAIPAFRLSDEAIGSDIERVAALGVTTEYGVNIDKPFFQKLRNQNDFIYISTGAQLSAKLDIENIRAEGVLDPLKFLYNAKQNLPTGIGKNVVIIGGGNTAMDAARTAYRLVGENGRVTVIYRRTIKQMPADTGEIRAVMDEGMDMIELAAPLKINLPVNLTAGQPLRLHAITFIKMQLRGTDSSGRKKPEPIPGSQFTFACDTVIPAVGQETDIDFIDNKLLQTLPGNYQIQLPDVFIGGDAMRGASTAINAIGDGRKAAEAIISKAGLKTPRRDANGRTPRSPDEHLVSRSRRIKPATAQEIELSDRKNFRLVSQTFTEPETMHEAARCLLCDEFCSICMTVCPNLAFHTYEVRPGKFHTKKIWFDDGSHQLAEGLPFVLTQKYQILHIADWCNACGNCTTFCPTADAPYKVKPHLYLNRKTFDEEKDGYFLNRSSSVDAVYFKKGTHQAMLAKRDGHFLYQSDDTVVSLDLDDFMPLDISTAKKDKFEIDLLEAVEMSIVMQGAKSFFNLI